MFVHKLQNLGFLIILLSVINTSFHPYPVQEESFNSYPVYRVALNPRGDDEIFNLCIHWYDYTQQEKWTKCGLPNTSPSSETSPDWSIGYKLSIHTIDGTFHAEPYLWWDGWIAGVYCNDLYLHTSGWDLVLSYVINIVYDNKYFWE
ncbi:1321_t:CDS:1 [Funneliformis geosporum]|uniref:3324_t:CDS:1 n=1 Tax=Funneliformis geosporum TaxID=1117311 RepID=A0A9W4SUN4_9GLOM|nr:1321_t:CDS:1 [Funneliformis geosporum]CAI2182063.1 3324_t:CDS:1 [Funneliformis geosporum]